MEGVAMIQTTKRGGAAPARAGRAFEWEVRDHLQARGYLVTRSAGSGGIADLVAVRNVRTGDVLLIQCKRGGVLPTAEWNRLFEEADARGAVAVLASRVPDFSRRRGSSRLCLEQLLRVFTPRRPEEESRVEFHP